MKHLHWLMQIAFLLVAFQPKTEARACQPCPAPAIYVSDFQAGTHKKIHEKHRLKKRVQKFFQKLKKHFGKRGRNSRTIYGYIALGLLALAVVGLLAIGNFLWWPEILFFISLPSSLVMAILGVIHDEIRAPAWVALVFSGMGVLSILIIFIYLLNCDDCFGD